MQVDDPNNIWRMEMLTDNGRPLRVGATYPNGDPHPYGGVPVDRVVAQAHAPRFMTGPWFPDVRGIDHDARLYVFRFKMFTEAEDDAGAYARSRTEAWSIAAFDEAVGMISVLELGWVGATRVGNRGDWAGRPSGRIMWAGEQQEIDGQMPYGGVIADLSADDTAVDWDALTRMRQQREDAERLEYRTLFAREFSLVAIVVDDNSGVGGIVAEVLADEGVRVALVKPEHSDLDTAAVEITGTKGVEVLPFVVEVGNNDQVRAMAQRVRDHFGKVDVVVNVAIADGNDDPDVISSRTERTIDLYQLPPDTGSTTRWLFDWDSERLRRFLPTRMRLDLIDVVLDLIFDRAHVINIVPRS